MIPEVIKSFFQKNYVFNFFFRAQRESSWTDIITNNAANTLETICNNTPATQELCEQLSNLIKEFGEEHPDLVAGLALSLAAIPIGVLSGFILNSMLAKNDDISMSESSSNSASNQNAHSEGDSSMEESLPTSSSNQNESSISSTQNIPMNSSSNSIVIGSPSSQNNTPMQITSPHLSRQVIKRFGEDPFSALTPLLKTKADKTTEKKKEKDKNLGKNKNPEKGKDKSQEKKKQKKK